MTRTRCPECGRADHIRDPAGITITRTGGKKTIVLPRHIKNRCLVAVGPISARAALGRFPLPVEVIPFGLAATRRKVEAAAIAAGSAGPALLRRGSDGHAFVTDSGHWILDAAFERIADPKSLADRLDATAGVVEHGLFIGLAHAAVLAGASGVRVVERA